MSSGGTSDGGSTSGAGDADQFDRQRRRVLWALPTGLYLIGSRHEDRVNLMTANLVVQVCLEPKLVAVAVEAESVTAGLIARGGAFTLSLLARESRDVVRKFVKPVTELEHDQQGALVALSGQRVAEVGSDRLPVLAAAAGYLRCELTSREELGSHILFVGEVAEVGGEPTEVLRMEDTRLHYGG